MPTDIRFEPDMPPAKLDRYLERGWRPLGQRIYSCDYLQLTPGVIFSVLPTRLDLESHTWTKGQLKLLRRNARQFTARFGPAEVTRAHRQVNARYLREFPDKSVEDLYYHFEYEGKPAFKTWQCCLFHENKLVAFSYFDLGEKSAYSKTGIYDPGYGRFSLGMYTLLLEVEFCMKNGFHYYYPGYVSPENPLFDYKHRIGKLSFWSVHDGEWLAFSGFQPGKHSPLQIVRDRLEQLESALKDSPRLTTATLSHPFYQMRLNYPDDHILDHVAYLRVINAPVNAISVYDLSARRYEWLEVSPLFFSPFTDQGLYAKWPPTPWMLLQRKRLYHTENADDMATYIKKTVMQSAPG